MSKNLKVYQTLKNTDNPDYVEANGPFACTWSNAWLGEGYYFWEAFINSAHWWGKCHCDDNYFICEANCVKTDTNCFDLVGDTDHMKIFSDTIEEMRTKGLISSKTTVPRVIKYLKDDIRIFKFDATRAVGYSSIGTKKNIKYIKRLLFEPTTANKPEHYIDYMPPIQICFYRKNSMNLSGVKVIFPEEYNYGNNYVL